MDEEEKKDLLKKLKKENIKIDIDDFDDLYDILDNLNTVTL